MAHSDDVCWMPDSFALLPTATHQAAVILADAQLRDLIGPLTHTPGSHGYGYSTPAAPGTGVAGAEGGGVGTLDGVAGAKDGGVETVGGAASDGLVLASAAGYRLVACDLNDIDQLNARVLQISRAGDGDRTSTSTGNTCPAAAGANMEECVKVSDRDGGGSGAAHKMLGVGVAVDVPTLIVSECVTAYLDHHRADDIFRWAVRLVSENSANSPCEACRVCLLMC